MLLDQQDIAEQRRERLVARRAQSIRAKQLDQDLKELMGHEWGRRILWELARGAQSNPTTIADTTNVNETFLRLGRASESWRLLQRALAVAPQLYLAAANEAKHYDDALLLRASAEHDADAARARG